MADPIVVTQTSVARVDGPAPELAIGGEAFTAGMYLYEAATSKLMKATAGGTALQAQARWIALSDCEGDGKSCVVMRLGGRFNPGFAMTVGLDYWLSVTSAGGAVVSADRLVSAKYSTFLFVAETAAIAAPRFGGLNP